MKGEAPRIELLWWQGCPSWESARELLRKVMSETGLDPDSMSVIQIDTDEQAERHPEAHAPAAAGAARAATLGDAHSRSSRGQRP